MPHPCLEEVALRQNSSLNSAFGQIVAEILQQTKRYTLWHPHWFSHLDLQTGHVYMGSVDISFRKYIYKVKIPLNNPKLVGFACLKIYINQIWAEQYLQNVFLCTFFPQRIFIIPLWKLGYVPFVMGHKIGGCEAAQTTPTPSALGRIAHYHTEVPLLAILRQVD